MYEMPPDLNSPACDWAPTGFATGRRRSSSKNYVEFAVLRRPLGVDKQSVRKAVHVVALEVEHEVDLDVFTRSKVHT